MSARPWRKRRTMSPRRWRKYVERGGFRRPFFFVIPKGAEDGRLHSLSGWTQGNGPSLHMPLTTEIDSSPNSAWVDITEAPICSITHVVIYPPARAQ